MNLSDLITRNLKKNIKNYYLYVFALIFSVALYFSFVTLRYNPEMDEVAGSIKGAAALHSASVLLIVIVAVFLLYANMIFIKRRNKEIGLLQLIGLTKGKIFRILSIENLAIYASSMLIGIMFGFVFSRLITMILFKIIQVEQSVKLEFSSGALLQTLYVFVGIYIFIMLMNYVFIKKQSILSLFQVSSKAQDRVKKISIWEMIFGSMGLLMVGGGYYLSTLMFEGEITDMNKLMFTMLTILALVIIGTYLFYKNSVSFIFNIIRKRKKGYLSIREVLSLSSVMFRMKSNTLLLTVVTTVSALAIGLLSLSYISYYSVEATARDSVPNDYSFKSEEMKDRFTDELDEKQIAYNEIYRQAVRIKLDISEIAVSGSMLGDNLLLSALISDETVEGLHLANDEVVLALTNDAIQRVLPIKDQGNVVVMGSQGTNKLKLVDIEKENLLPLYYNGGSYTTIVSKETYQHVMKDLKPEIDGKMQVLDYYGIDIRNDAQQDASYEIFEALKFEYPNNSQHKAEIEQRSSMGMMMFIVGFLGLIFLITSGCILYFKQMDEGEEEKPSYTILRKLGYTQGDLLQGIQIKQLFNFGIPLIVGLSHSYFAVKSGWFFFGTELVTPMIIVMLLYTLLYSIFAVLSVLYYKRIIKESL